MSLATEEFKVFQDILRTAKAKGHGHAVARAVYEKRTGKPCPFYEREGDAPKVEPIIAFIDYETRSRCSIKDCGAAAYAEHPSTEVLCMAYRIGESTTQIWTPLDDGLSCPPDLVAHIAGGGLVEAHNAEFEQSIWTSICVKRLGWPEIPLAQWRDSMALCAAMAIPQALGKAAEALNAPIQKSDSSAMMKLCKPRKPTKADKSEWHEDPALYAELYAYCKQDVDAEIGLSTILPALSPTELRVWQATNAINRRGIHADRKAIDGALRIIDQATAAYDVKLRTATNGVLTADALGSWQQVLPWCASRSVQLENYQKDTLAKALMAGGLPPDVSLVLTARLSLGRTSNAKYASMRNHLCSDDRIRGTLNYHGAHHGRWAGRGIQPQNFTKGAFTPEQVDACIADFGLPLDAFEFFWGDALTAISHCLRGILCAAPGHVLLSADFKAIEQRTANWIAGQADTLETLRQFDAGVGPDSYKVMASKTFGIAIEAITRVQRDLGKAQELSCQFGCGWQTFQEAAGKAPYFLTLTDEEAKHAVTTYRETHPEVVSSWAKLEACAMRAVRVPGVATMFRDGVIRFKMIGEHLKMRLPSGRFITYPYARIEMRQVPWTDKSGNPVFKEAVTYMGENPDTHQWSRCGIYGGLLMNNCASGMARDLAAGAILRAEARNLPVVLMVHDDLISEVPESNPTTVKEYEALLCEPQPWAEGLPIAAEGYRGKRYRK